MSAARDFGVGQSTVRGHDSEMAAPNKQRILSKLLGHVGKSTPSFPKELSVLDHLLIGVIQEGTSWSKAHDAYVRLVKGFHDFNELRVSHYKELEPYLEGMGDAETKARRIIGILQFVFETTYAFDLESMRKKPLKQAQKQLSKISGATSYSVAAVVQRTLGGHALPIDAGMREFLARLEVIDENDDPESIRAGLEHAIPKAQGTAFSLFLSEFVADPKRCEQFIASVFPKAKKKTAKSPPPAAPKTKAVSPIDAKKSSPKKAPREKK